MGERFRVCIVVPPGYRHSHAFVELAYLLKGSLETRGRECDIAPNELSAERVNILLGYHLVEDPRVLDGCVYVAYQLEQLSAREGVYSPKIERVLRGARAVWDYSRDNVAFLASRGIGASWLPIGYHECLERVARAAEPDIDILFYGSVNERRRRVLRELEQEGARVEAVFGAYAKQRDRLIGRAKVILNVHHYAAQIFEQVRVSYLLNNRCFVVSEDSADYPYEGVEVCRAPYEQLAATCLTWLARERERRERGDAAYHQFRQHYPMSELVGEKIGPAGRRDDG